jgi:hypothetical protein
LQELLEADSDVSMHFSLEGFVQQQPQQKLDPKSPGSKVAEPHIKLKGIIKTMGGMLHIGYSHTRIWRVCFFTDEWYSLRRPPV